MNKMLFFIPIIAAMLLLAGCGGGTVEKTLGTGGTDKMVSLEVVPGPTDDFTVSGEIVKMQFIAPHSNVTTYTLLVATGTNRGTAETLWTQTVSNATDYILYPKVISDLNTGADISGEYSMYYINDLVEVTLTNASTNASNTGRLYVWYR